ncbi:hypothetical protein QR680_007075 [Steinernema hermaphroditum]|uniref:Uncharacterized protein n=1 Tax=Steinernema hermaphroditum TaxID=289476 RepID=A0AA39HZ26_9BILA|nr:hypothetical protein QR680_007075 [Steinernema hermaphroditum]
MLGLEQWFANFTQYSWDDNSAESLAEVPRPILEYMIYGTFKSAEIASFIGGCIAHPIYRVYLKSKITPDTLTNNTYKIIRTQCRRLQGRFLIGSLVAGPLTTLAYIHLSGMTEMELKEKCYKVRCSTVGLTTDRAALCFGFIGWYWKRFQGAVDGINVALLYSLIHEKILKPYTSPMMYDRVKEGERLEGGVGEREQTKTQLLRFLSGKNIRFEAEADTKE